MAYTLRFANRLDYDNGLSGITIPITLVLDDRQINVDAKLDTGASECIVPNQYAVALNLDLEQGWPVKIQTATGTFLTYRHEVTLLVAKYSFDVGICFAADEGLRFGVLGRYGFLDRVNIRLIDYQSQLYLSQYGEDDS